METTIEKLTRYVRERFATQFEDPDEEGGEDYAMAGVRVRPRPPSGASGIALPEPD